MWIITVIMVNNEWVRSDAVFELWSNPYTNSRLRDEYYYLSGVSDSDHNLGHVWLTGERLAYFFLFHFLPWQCCYLTVFSSFFFYFFFCGGGEIWIMGTSKERANLAIKHVLCEQVGPNFLFNILQQMPLD